MAEKGKSFADLPDGDFGELARAEIHTGLGLRYIFWSTDERRRIDIGFRRVGDFNMTFAGARLSAAPLFGVAAALGLDDWSSAALVAPGPIAGAGLLAAFSLVAIYLFLRWRRTWS